VKQPDNKQAKMFGNDGPVGNDAEIIVYYEYNGPVKLRYIEQQRHLRSPTRIGLKVTSMCRQSLTTNT